MNSEGFVQKVLETIAMLASHLLLPSMVALFFVGVTLRFLIFYTMKREEWFSKEFEKRVVNFGDQMANPPSFFVLGKRLLEKTFYELFEVRGIMKRRKLDYIMAPSDRVFLIQAGSARLVKDTLRQIKYLKYNGTEPRFIDIAKDVFQNNPCFNRVLGIIPAAPVNDFLNVLPSLFIVFGIFGTFLGIMKGLPELRGMNLSDIEGSKLVMDTFLMKIAFSMSTSSVGIILFLTGTAFNAFVSPERVFVDTVSRYERCLEYLWNRCENNILPESIPNFDENRDPVEALAEFALNKEIAKVKNGGVTRELQPGQQAPATPAEKSEPPQKIAS